ncbi:MAG TPA: S1 RNA-binding domain-containing protein [Pirellulales bacterium]|nr:S1 RNA-binding domain-containing protein [Pirellulales bacterium]
MSNDPIDVSAAPEASATSAPPIAAPSGAAEPAAPAKPAPYQPPRIRIGTQRPQSPKIQAKPKPLPGESKPGESKPGESKPDESKPEDAAPAKKTPVPSIRKQLSPELELEVELALGGLSLEEVLDPATASGASAAAGELEPDTRVEGRVASVHRDNVFVDLGRRNQGILSLRQFPESPPPGTVLDVMVNRFDADEGLYQLSLPGAAVEVADWSQLTEGLLVSARITGHNKGGLECEVNHIRGFIPAGQISLFRIEDFSQFVGEALLCIVTEARPEKRNLVLSRRAVLEREKAEAKTKLLAELHEGDIRDGTVRSLQDYGAFIDLGGIDGLLHVSQLSWQRVRHPNEVLTVGQPIKVKIKKIDSETGKISLAFRDLTENPWTSAAYKYPVTSKHTGTVSKIMDFGAFVQLEPGIEGLVHVSELAHGRVWRTSDVVSEGQEVEVKVLSVDAEQQRISLSLKALMARPEAAKKAEPDVPEPDESPVAPAKKRTTPLKGGMGRGTGGEEFGLKW